MQNDLTGIVTVFGAALAAAWVMRAVRAPTIVGFLLAGVLVGPGGLGLVARESVQFYAELGLVLLLFVVGLEMSPEPLRRAGRRLAVAALLQIVLTTLLAAAALYALGGMGRLPALVLGVAVSLSSTAIMVNHFASRGETESPASLIGTIISLLQDVFSLLALIALPLVARTGGPDAASTLAGAGLSLAGLLVATGLARLVVPGLVQVVFRFGGTEFTTLFAILMAAAGAWLASQAGWSWALGSFIAGLLLAQSDLRHQLRADITPFRDAFNALFFLSIGMLVQPAVLAQGWEALVPVILLTLVLKAAVAAGAVVLAGWPLRLAVLVGLALCTISEFGYVLAKEAHDRGLIDAATFAWFVAWTVGTMVGGAVFITGSSPLALALARRLQREVPDERAGEEAPALASHVIIVGYGVNGRNLASVLRATRIPFIVVEASRVNARAAREDGATVLVGDAVRRDILLRAGLRQARALVVAIADSFATRRIVAQARALRPDLYILARTRYVAELEPLRRLGASRVIPEEFETSIEIFAHVLQEFGVPSNVIEQQVTLVRAGQYGMLRGRPTDAALRSEWLSLLEAAVTRTHLLPRHSPAAGRSLREVDLRARTGATIVAITRSGQPVPNPPPEFVLAPGDVLVLVGSHKQLDAARAALEPPAGPRDDA